MHDAAALGSFACAAGISSIARAVNALHLHVQLAPWCQFDTSTPLQVNVGLCHIKYLMWFANTTV
jgi:hypothetical protein